MTNTQMRAAIYTRVSSEEQAREGLSLGIQADRCQAYAEAQDWVVVETFTDAGVSGAKAQRPKLDAMLAAVERGEVDVIVVAKLDRLARSMRNLSPLLGSLDDKGVSLVSIVESFNSGDTNGRMMRNMLGVMAEWERDVICDRTRAGVNARVRAGGWGGGHMAPFGYHVVGVDALAHLEVDLREAEVVLMALSLVLDQGLSTLEAAKRLNALGLTPRSAALWTSSNLRNCLCRGQWDGRWTFGKVSPKRTVPEPIVVAVEPIVDAERAAALAAHLKRTHLVRGAKGVHPLSGRLICICGQPMTGMARSDRANRRYRCRHGFQQPGRQRCPEPSVLADAVDDAVWAQVLNLLTDPDSLMALAQERLEMLQGAQVVEVNALQDAERAVAKTQKALSDGAAKCIMAGLDDETMEATLTTLHEHHRQALQHRAKVAAVSQETTAAKARMATAQELAQIARQRLLHANRALQAKVFALLDVRATITRHGDQVEIRLEGSVAHDLLLAGVRDDLSPSKQASCRLSLRPGRW
jgi:DNA invertase Pin-like site-specific DNA recombinase